MKISFISNLYPPFVLGGAEISVRRVAEGLAKKGHEVLVITTSPNRKRYSEKINGVKIYRLGMTNIYPIYTWETQPMIIKPIYHIINLWSPYSYVVIKNILKKEMPDVVHINNYKGLSLSVFSAVKSLNLPLIFTARDYSLICLKNNLLNSHGEVGKTVSMQCRLYNKFVKYIVNNKPKIVITASQFASNKLREIGLFKNIEVVVLPNAIKLGNLSSIKKYYDTIDILYAGALSRYKGVHILINAFKELKSKNIRLHIVGKGKEEEEFKKIAGSDQRITFYGFKTGEELMNFYKRANVVVAPSLYLETFGLVIIESFKYGTPVVGSKIGAYPELIKNGYNGFSFEAGNVDELKDKIEYLIENPSELKRLENGAFESAKKYDIGEHIKKLEDIYEAVVEQQCRGRGYIRI